MINPTSEVFNEDCITVMKRYPDGYFDLAIVDPPYGINAPNMSMGSNLSRDDGWKREPSTAIKLKKKGRLNSGGGKLKNRLLNTSAIEWDNEPPTDEYFEELFRVSKNQIIWGGNYFDLPPTRCVVCWDKCQPWENFSQWEMAWTSFDKPAALFSYSNTGGANAEKKIHPTQKPIALYRWLIKKFACAGDRIIDTHLGSQSSRIAAYKLGFDFWGCEISSNYFIDGNARYTEAINEPLLNAISVEQRQLFSDDPTTNEMLKEFNKGK
jgi:site-specific DNA-methyltransferase (adenine-specific)